MFFEDQPAPDKASALDTLAQKPNDEAEVPEAKVDKTSSREEVEYAAVTSLVETLTAVTDNYSAVELVAMQKRQDAAAGLPDVGDVVLGTARQTVDIIPGRLKVTFRMLTTAHRGAILRAKQALLSGKVSGVQHGGNMPSAEDMYVDKVLTLACTIAGIQEAELANPLPNAGTRTFDEKILNANTTHIGSMPDLLFWQVWYSYAFFAKRCQNAVSAEALGNG